MESDLNLNLAAFRPSSIPHATTELNDALIKACSADTKWWTVSRSDLLKSPSDFWSAVPQNTEDVGLQEKHRFQCLPCSKMHPLSR